VILWSARVLLLGMHGLTHPHLLLLLLLLFFSADMDYFTTR
jgi:hypothetical protein